MDYNDIILLLNKYWDGETSLQEEKILKDYFNSGKTDPRLSAYAPMFQYIQKEQQVSLDNDDFSSEITNKTTRDNVKPLKRNQIWMRMAAAILFLVVGAWIYCSLQTDNLNNTGSKYAVKVYEVEDPEEAKIIVKEALMMVSGKMNQGAKKASDGINNFNKIKNIISRKGK